MSAEEHLQPRQFGPGGKYTTKPVGPRHIEAVHTGSGRRIGAMDWFSEPIGRTGIQNAAGQTIEPDKPTIFKVVVSKPMRRKGVATAMLNHARDISPGLQHSNALSEDGTEWAKKRP